MPIQTFRNIPEMTTQLIPDPNMAPLRVASMTSPDPINSDTHTMDGPSTANMASPVRGALMELRDCIELDLEKKDTKKTCQAGPGRFN